jgi:hypothetical protein
MSDGPSDERRSPAGPSLALVLVWCWCWIQVTGCAGDPTAGYSMAAIYPADVRTVAVPILENDTLVRDIEFELTDALVKEIEARTPYKVTTQVRADTILLARIRRVELTQLSKSRVTGLGEEAVVGVTIDFEWRDLRSDAARVVRRDFAGHGLFVPSAPARERIELGRTAALQQLARDVVTEMQAAW